MGGGNGVCRPLRECTSADVLNANGLFCVFSPLSRWQTAVACPKLTRCVCLCLCDRNGFGETAINVVEQAGQGWIISAEGQVEGWMA